MSLAQGPTSPSGVASKTTCAVYSVRVARPAPDMIAQGREGVERVSTRQAPRMSSALPIVCARSTMLPLWGAQTPSHQALPSGWVP